MPSDNPYKSDPGALCTHTTEGACHAKAVTKHCVPCASQRLCHCCGHEPRGVATHTGREAQPPWGYSFGEQPPGPQHSSRRSDTKQAAPRPTRACPLGAEYLLEAESLSVDRVGRLSGRPAASACSAPRSQGLHRAWLRPSRGGRGRNGRSKGGNAANRLPNVAVTVLGLLRDIHSVPRGSSLPVTGGRSSELSTGLFSDFKGNFQRNIK